MNLLDKSYGHKDSPPPPTIVELAEKLSSQHSIGIQPVEMSDRVTQGSLSSWAARHAPEPFIETGLANQVLQGKMETTIGEIPSHHLREYFPKGTSTSTLSATVISHPRPNVH